MPDPILIQYGNYYNVPIHLYYIEADSDASNIPAGAPVGSMAYVNESSNFHVLMKDSSNNWNKISASGGGGSDGGVTETTYSELKALRDGGNLSVGTTYRMTDYVTKINGSYDLSAVGGSGYLHCGKSAEHPYDLLLYAVDESHLSEIAMAALHDGDTYFAGVDIGAWKLLYCIDNDTARFSWADATNGKGVVYWMRDEWGNEAWFDFKNVLNVRYALLTTGDDTGLAYNSITQPNRYGSPYHVFTALKSYMESGSYVDPLPGDYDFVVAGNILGTVQIPSIDETYLSIFNADLYYTFDYLDGNGNHVDASLNGNTKVPVMNNVFAYESDSVVSLLTGGIKMMGLNYSCFETNSVFTDELSGTNADRITGNRIGTNTWYCTFGNLCENEVLADISYANTFGNSCQNNTFGNSCHDNTFGDSCYYNTFGDSCYSNTFGYSCQSNTFGDSCYSNIFGNLCGSNTFGDSCYDNTFGDSCYYNTFGNNCMYLDVFRTANTGNAQYYTVLDGVHGQNGSHEQIGILPGMANQIFVGVNTAGNIVTWCPADLAN